MAAMNKQLLIFENRGDSIRCTPYRGKPDQHDIYTSYSSWHTPDVGFLRTVPVRGNPSWVTDKVGQSHCSREKGLPKFWFETSTAWSSLTIRLNYTLSNLIRIFITQGVRPSLPNFTIAPCVDSLLCYTSIKQPKSIFQDSPKF
jgi:hypothetical protein